MLYLSQFSFSSPSAASSLSNQHLFSLWQIESLLAASQYCCTLACRILAVLKKKERKKTVSLSSASSPFLGRKTTSPPTKTAPTSAETAAPFLAKIAMKKFVGQVVGF
jgi:hypothetical protein